MKKINMLALNKSPGIDGIVPILLKENKNYLCEPLSIIYTESLKKGIVPADWKRANVTPIFKKGPRELHCNYRLISLTSHVYVRRLMGIQFMLMTVCVTAWPSHARSATV